MKYETAADAYADKYKTIVRSGKWTGRRREKYQILM
jgi:hypothetical protein